MTLQRAIARRRPGTLVSGLLLILVSEALLAVDVWLRGGAVVPYDPIPVPDTFLGLIARTGAQFVTPLCWTGFILAADGLLDRWGGSPFRQRPLRAAYAYLTSVAVWLFFDAINFGLLDAWSYHNLPMAEGVALLAYFLSFAAISPAMFMAAEIVRRCGLEDVPGPRLALGRRAEAWCMAVGALAILFPILIADPAGTLTLWVGMFLLLDPLNRRLGMPSLFRDWAQGRWGRTLALLAGGLLCGLLWEFWNYWAIAKWTYHLPFLGPFEEIRYFEMPVLGLLGFPPFALECWAAFNTLVWLAGRLRMKGIEPLPPRHVL